MKNDTVVGIIVCIVIMTIICFGAYQQYKFRQKTFTIIDSEGTTYQNLHRNNKGWYVDSDGRLLEFHGDYKVIEEKAEK